MTERFVDLPDGDRLWAEDAGPTDGTTVLLVMGANASGVTWPDELVERLAFTHHVIRYDHRDTGRSTWAYDERPYAIRELADDAVAVLDAFGVERAHVAGMSMGGTLVQLLLLEHADRLRSATLLCTSALGRGLAAPDGDGELPGPDPRLLELWETMGQPRSPAAELAWRVEHWRLLNGDVVAFDPEEFAALERRVIAHTGHAESSSAHARADQSGLDRGDGLASVRTPTLVIEAPADPVNPPPHAEHLASAIPGALLVSIPGMGHALPASIVPQVATAIADFVAGVDG